MRGPNGKFLSWGSELEAWLPWLLDRGLPSMKLREMLETSAKWNMLEASEHLIQGGNIMKSVTQDPADDNQAQFSAPYHIGRYRKHVATAALLRECAAKVREVWQ